MEGQKRFFKQSFSHRKSTWLLPGCHFSYKIDLENKSFSSKKNICWKQKGWLTCMNASFFYLDNSFWLFLALLIGEINMAFQKQNKRTFFRKTIACSNHISLPNKFNNLKIFVENLKTMLVKFLFVSFNNVLFALCWLS